MSAAARPKNREDTPFYGVHYLVGLPGRPDAPTTRCSSSMLFGLSLLPVGVAAAEEEVPLTRTGKFSRRWSLKIMWITADDLVVTRSRRIRDPTHGASIDLSERFPDTIPGGWGRRLNPSRRINRSPTTSGGSIQSLQNSVLTF